MSTIHDARFEFVRFAMPTDGLAATRLQGLRQAVESLANGKATDPSGQIEVDDIGLSRWVSMLPPEALATFDTEPPGGAWLPPSGLIEPGWDERSMLAAILGAETRLHGLFEVEAGVAELRFEALAWPYGGITSLIRLVEAFGFDIISYDEGSMPEVSRATHLAWAKR